MTEGTREQSRGVGRLSARAAWSLWALCVVLIALAALLNFLTDVNPLQYCCSAPSDRDRPWLDFLIDRYPFPTERQGPGLAVLTGILTLVYPTVGALVVSRLPRNPIGWIFCSIGLIYGVRSFTLAYSDYALLENFALPWGEYVAWVSMLVGFSGLVLLGMFLMLLFPEGRLPSRRWRIVAWTAIFAAGLNMFGDAFNPGALPTHGYIDNPFGVAGVIGGVLTTYDLFAASNLLGLILLAVCDLAALLSLTVRLRRARGDERQQLKWFLYAAAPAAVGLFVYLLSSIVLIYMRNFSVEHQVYYANFYVSLDPALFALLVLPVFTYVAILRYRLYDIDRLINRTLLYGALTLCIVGIYVLVVGGLSALFQARGNLAVSLLATGLVAILFQPLRSRLQHGVNRLIYGERDDPYAVISRLGRRLEATLAPETVLPTVVETIAQALKLPYVAILLNEGGGFRSAAAYGSPVGEPEALPLVYQREEIGRLLLSPRAPGEEFSSADRRLLEDLARQAEVAVHTISLTADLQRSRERLVATREEERRRLRRDLHDGLGPTLASLALKLDAARKLVRPKPADTEELLSRMKDQAEDTVSDVRRLVYGLRPPALDDLGLSAAVRQQAEGHGFVVDSFSGDKAKVPAREDGSIFFALEAPATLSPLPAAVEVAAYRIAQEAITNVVRHANAKTCSVRISVDRGGGVLELEVRDDGVGVPEDRQAGVGLSSMRERAEELGGRCKVEPIPTGGTRVLARLPLPTSREVPQGARSSSWSAPSESS